jgi:hypothetical protein
MKGGRGEEGGGGKVIHSKILSLEDHSKVIFTLGHRKIVPVPASCF